MKSFHPYRPSLRLFAEEPQINANKWVSYFTCDNSRMLVTADIKLTEATECLEYWIEQLVG